MVNMSNINFDCKVPILQIKEKHRNWAAVANIRDGLEIKLTGYPALILGSNFTGYSAVYNLIFDRIPDIWLNFRPDNGYLAE